MNTKQSKPFEPISDCGQAEISVEDIMDALRTPSSDINGWWIRSHDEEDPTLSVAEWPPASTPRAK